MHDKRSQLLRSYSTAMQTFSKPMMFNIMYYYHLSHEPNRNYDMNPFSHKFFVNAQIVLSRMEGW